MAALRLFFSAVSSLLVISFLLVNSLPAMADIGTELNSQSMVVNQTIGDGKNGRSFAKWTYSPENRPIESISIVMSRVNGGEDTFVNLRFEGGEALENGKRVHVRGGKSLTTGTWTVSGQQAKGRPLALNAYNGEVRVGRVTINYQGAAADNQQQSSSGYTLGNHPFGGSGQTAAADRADEEYCRHERVRPPRLEISDMRATGGLFSGKYRVYGEIFGQCIEEAGYYERGRLKQKFDVPFDSRYARTEFETKVESGKDGEIRVLTSDGREDRILIDEEITRRRLN